MSEKTREVRMLQSLVGGDFAFDQGTTYTVPEPLAIAWCTEPADDPRAVPVGWELTAKGKPAKRTASVKTAETAAEKPGKGAKAQKQTTETAAEQQAAAEAAEAEEAEAAAAAAAAEQGWSADSDD